MSSIMKVFLLLALVAVMAQAQFNQSESSCLCSTVRNSIQRGPKIVDIKILPASNYCSKVEIVVTMGNGNRLCLNPKAKNVEKLLSKIMKKNTVGTTSIVLTSSSPDRSTTTSL